MTAPSTDPAAAAEHIRNQFEAGVLALQSNGELTTEAITRRIAQAYVKASDDLAALQARSTGDVENRKAQLLRQAFGTAGVSGDPASLAMSARDASERVAAIDPTDWYSAQALLDRAEMNGDEVLARAIGAAAYSNPLGGWSTVLDAFLARRSRATQALSELDQLSRQSAQSNVFSAWTFMLPKPSALSGLDDWQIRSLAAEAGA